MEFVTPVYAKGYKSLAAQPALTYPVAAAPGTDSKCSGFAYLLPRVFVAGDTNLHDAGAVTAVDATFNGVRLFFESRALNSTRSASSIFFHPFAVAVNSLHPDSKVSTCALVGAMSMPFCVSGPRTVL